MLSYRLERIVFNVPACESVADIGTDHGYVPIALARRGDVKHIIGMDVRKGPLSRAEKNIEAENLTDKIELRLSDGAEKLKENEAKVIVTAGMGGNLMTEIMDRGEAAYKSADLLVLSPQSELFEFRNNLLKKGYSILKEEILKDEGKFYFILCVKYTGLTEVYKDHELEFGKYLIDRADPILVEYLLKCKEIKLSLIDKLKASSSPLAQNSIKECEKYVLLIDKALAMSGQKGNL